MTSRAPLLLAGLAAVSFGFVVVPAGVLMWQRVFEPLPREGLQVLRLVHNQVVEEYVTEVDPNELLENAVAGMVERLDRHCQFVPAERAEAFEHDQIDGSYVGVGVLLFPDHAPITIRSPLPGSPAETAGLRPGDRIVAVDGHELGGLAPDAALKEAVALMRGPEGSSVTVRIESGNAGPREVELTRQELAQPLVKWVRLVDPRARLGYVYLRGFQRDVGLQLGVAIEALEAEAGGALAGLVIDLRHNPGGPLAEAVAVANRFLPAGEIVSLKRRSDTVERLVADPALCTHPDLPLVVLINGDSASASEVVTGALQDHGRATVVGIRSYGKGLVQSVFAWRGFDFRLRLTTAHYYTPSGRSIEKRLRRAGDPEDVGGIAPDREVRLDPPQALLVETRLAAHEVPAVYRDAAREAALAIGAELPTAPTPADDPQLAAALEELGKLVAARAEAR